MNQIIRVPIDTNLIFFLRIEVLLTDTAHFSGNVVPIFLVPPRVHFST